MQMSTLPFHLATQSPATYSERVDRNSHCCCGSLCTSSSSSSTLLDHHMVGFSPAAKAADPKLPTNDPVVSEAMVALLEAFANQVQRQALVMIQQQLQQQHMLLHCANSIPASKQFATTLALIQTAVVALDFAAGVTPATLAGTACMPPRRGLLPAALAAAATLRTTCSPQRWLWWQWQAQQQDFLSKVGECGMGSGVCRWCVGVCVCVCVVVVLHVAVHDRHTHLCASCACS
jgi:hypothetical protein